MAKVALHSTIGPSGCSRRIFHWALDELTRNLANATLRFTLFDLGLAIAAAGRVDEGARLYHFTRATGVLGLELNRDRLFEAVKPGGWLGIRMVALDETWSAMRFRPAEKVGK